MAKVTPLMQSMERQDKEVYLIGSSCHRKTKNPYNDVSEVRQYQAWSAGHFDKWGRVDD